MNSIKELQENCNRKVFIFFYMFGAANFFSWKGGLVFDAILKENTELSGCGKENQDSFPVCVLKFLFIKNFQIVVPKSKNVNRMYWW